jgi:hypothetical protein
LAAAAALQVLGDPNALGALRGCSEDSDTVQRQIDRTIEALERVERAQRDAEILVQLGQMQNATGVDADSALRHLRAESRRKLSELPGVAMLAGTSANGKPVVMLTGQIAQLSATRNGKKIVYSAKVQYVVHRMPERAIAAAVTGSAKASTSVRDARDKRRAAEVRATVLEAAVASALGSIRTALDAAAVR